MRSLIMVLMAAFSFSAAGAAQVINVEFDFTPYVGHPESEDVVQTVSGTAHVFLNGVPFADQEVSESEAPVLFDDREIAAAVWVSAESCGPALRHGTNKIRIEFRPADPEVSYRASFRWSQVMDETTTESDPGKTTETNRAGPGVEDKEGHGPIVFEHEFQADFARDLPWHHFPAVAALDDGDRAALANLVQQRLEAFRPDFAGIYHLMERNENLDVEGVRKSKCLDQAFAAGIRIAAPAPKELDFVTTGQPEVIIRAKSDRLFFPEDMTALQRIDDEDVQMCIGAALSVVYPPRLVVVRLPSGEWETVY